MVATTQTNKVAYYNKLVEALGLLRDWAQRHDKSSKTSLLNLRTQAAERAWRERQAVGFEASIDDVLTRRMDGTLDGCLHIAQILPPDAPASLLNALVTVLQWGAEVQTDEPKEEIDLKLKALGGTLQERFGSRLPREALSFQLLYFMDKRFRADALGHERRYTVKEKDDDPSPRR